MSRIRYSMTRAGALSVASVIPTFILLNLNGTSLFYGFGTVSTISVLVGAIVFAAVLIAPSLRQSDASQPRQVEV